MVGIIKGLMFADALYASHDKCISPGPWLSTIALRLSYYKNNFKYIEPIEKDLSYDRPDPTFVYFVPIEESLTAMLACPNVQKNVDKSFQRVPGEGNVVRDYYDGLVYQKRGQTGKTVDVFIFQDAFKPTNDRSLVANNPVNILTFSEYPGDVPSGRRDIPESTSLAHAQE